MKAIIFLIILIVIYYQFNKKKPEYLTNKNHMYFGSFILLYLVLCYLMNYQQFFVYKVLKNIKEADDQPLYDIESSMYKDNKMAGVKSHLAMRQGWRCINCQNPILPEDLYEHQIDYIKPLQFGGTNDVNNIGIRCNGCSSFKPY
jgi:hypothetical protein